MPTVQTFDKLNQLRQKPWSMPIDKYFNEMKLTKEQKKERIALAEKIEDAVLFFFYLILTMNQYSYIAGMDSAYAKEQLKERIQNAIDGRIEVNTDIQEDIDRYVDDVTDTSTEALMVLVALYADEEKRSNAQRHLSEDKARLLAEEEANTLFNVADYYKAKELGYRYKTWITKRDNRVRKTHERVDSRKIPIDDLFLVGESYMRFPRDQKYGASMKEIAGCRCSLKYTKE